MNREDAEEYTESLGQIVAGSWRQIAWADRQGIPKALGLTTREWVEDRLGGYVRLSISDRREAVAELTEEGMTNYDAADVLGVDETTIRRDRAAANAAAIPPEQVEPPSAAAKAAPPEDGRSKQRIEDSPEARSRDAHRCLEQILILAQAGRTEGHIKAWVVEMREFDAELVARVEEAAAILAALAERMADELPGSR